MKKHLIPVLLGAAALIGAIVWMVFPTVDPESKQMLSPRKSSAAAGTAIIDMDKTHRRERGPSIALRQHERKLTRHEVNQLKDFILPRFEGSDISLNEALGILKEAYQEACFRSHEKPLALGFSVRDEPDHALSFSMGGKSFLACLNHLAALAGLTVEREELNFVLFRSDTADQPGELLLKKDPMAVSQLLALAGQIRGVGGDDWISLLRTTGFILETGTTLTEVKNGFHVLKGSNAEIERMKSALALATQSPSQLKFAQKFVTTTSPLELTNTSLSDAEARQLLRDLAQTKGTKLTSTPSVTAREGQSSTMEMIRETSSNGQPAWTGIRNTYEASRTGLKVVGIDHSEHRPEDTGELGWQAETNSAISPGGTHVQLLASRDGTYHYRMLTVTPIDATGRPLGSGELVSEENTAENPPPVQNRAGAPVANRVPGKDHFIFSPYNNKIVDVAGIPSGTLVADPSFPAGETKLPRSVTG